MLEFYGDITPGNRFLTPYLQRGDVVIPEISLEKLEFAKPYIGEFIRRQCVNTAKEWIAKKRKGDQVVLFDPTGQCVGVAAELCALGKTVWVATSKGEEYAPCAEYCMLTFGNPPVIGAYIPPSADLVIAPYGVPSGEVPPRVSVVAPGYIWATEKDLTLPKELMDATPAGFDPVAVAAGCFAMFRAGMEEKARLTITAQERKE